MSLLLIKLQKQKAFNSVNHNFLLNVLENYDISQYFLKWISIILQNQESCVIKGV